MKKFFVMILLVSTFFIGLSALIERAGAQLRSDARALELIRQARIAVGGDANLRGVNSMTIVGTSTHFFDKEGLRQSEQGTIEINMQLPGQFSKMLRFGNPDNSAADGGNVTKTIDVIVSRKSDDGSEAVAAAAPGEKGVFVIKKDDGGEATWTDENENQVKMDGDHIFIKKDDGTVEELKTDGPHKVIVRKSDEAGQTGVWNTEDGKRIVIEKGDNHFTAGPHMRQNEMLRTTMALLLTAPEGADVTYKYLGEGDVDGNPSNIIEVSDGGSAFKLYLDKATFRPRMVSFEGHDFSKMVRFKKEDLKDLPKEDLIQLKTDLAKAEPIEHQIKFSDFRSVGGLLLPYRWTESVGGREMQTIDITGYEVNPANIADKFQKQKVFVRKAKPNN
ncbi:MAG: hypothetical protein R2747_10165 [Pyrinomonadaceae bacterium]